MKLRLATLADVDQISRWRMERADWLRARGSDQWSDAGLTMEEFMQRIRESVVRRETWIAEDERGRAVGTIGIDCRADDGLWDDEELSEALVIHRMIVPLGARGLGVGSFMLSEAEKMARQQSKRELLLDAWDSNNDLHRYYRSHGFEYVRTAQNHSTPSATLFAKEIHNPA